MSQRILALAAVAFSVLIGCNAAAEQAAIRTVRETGGRVSFAGKGPEVEFSNMDLTDEELASIKSLPYVHRLRIINVPLEDSAVDVLLSVERIDILLVVGTKISEEGLKRLKARFPSMERQLR